MFLRGRRSHKDRLVNIAVEQCMLLEAERVASLFVLVAPEGRLHSGACMHQVLAIGGDGPLPLTLTVMKGIWVARGDAGRRCCHILRDVNGRGAMLGRKRAPIPALGFLLTVGRRGDRVVGGTLDDPRIICLLLANHSTSIHRVGIHAQVKLEDVLDWLASALLRL